MDGRKPDWAPRIAQHKIRQIYEDDARGTHDDELIEDVGYSLLTRCQSFIDANERAGARRNVLPAARRWNTTGKTHRWSALAVGHSRGRPISRRSRVTSCAVATT
jgi:hypothetical protein